MPANVRILAVGLGFFQLHLHSVIPCLRALQIDVYFENCINITKPCQVTHLPVFNQQWLQRLKFDGNRFEQLNSAQQPSPSCAIVLIKAFTTIIQKHIVCSCDRFSDYKVHPSTFIKMRATPLLSFSCWNDFFYVCKC